MADGTVKAIDQVEPGDEVLATDPETGEKEAKQVEATHGHDDVVLTLVLTTSTGEMREIRTTEDHPFWSQTEQEFQRADELDAGELVLTADGGTMEVDAVLTEEVTFEPAWNLTVQGLHTYSVIATGADVGAGSTRGPPAADAVLVHNCDPVDVYIRYESGMSRDWFEIKAANLTRLSDAGVLVKTKSPERIKGLTGRFRNNAIADLWSKTSPGSLRSHWYGKLSDTKGYQIDHVHELQLGGVDDLSNMGLMETVTNNRVGSQIYQQLYRVSYGTRVKIHVMGPT
jgi:hypothetical protein